MKQIIFILILLFFFSCIDSHPEIKITKDYIENDAWNDNYPTQVFFRKIFVDTNRIKFNQISSYDGFEIWHAILDDSIHSERNRLQYDYCLYSKNNDNHNPKRIYFNKKNGDLLWNIAGTPLEKSKPLFGNLESNTWYAFYGLYEKWEYYVYIDNYGKSYVWSINPVNI